MSDKVDIQKVLEVARGILSNQQVAALLCHCTMSSLQNVLTDLESSEEMDLDFSDTEYGLLVVALAKFMNGPLADNPEAHAPMMVKLSEQILERAAAMRDKRKPGSQAALDHAKAVLVASGFGVKAY